jgi:hypothetical protein
MLGSMVSLQTVVSLPKYLMCACVSRTVPGVEEWIGGVDLEVGKEWKERVPEDTLVTWSETSWPNATNVVAQLIVPL